MSRPAAHPERRIAGLSVRLLSTHLDAVDPRTSEAVAGAVERLSAALVDWHDAVVTAHPQHQGAPAAAAPVPVAVPDGPSTAQLVELIERDGLAGVGASAAATAQELHGTSIAAQQVARELASGETGTEPAARSALADRGSAIARAAAALATALDTLAQTISRERTRLAHASGDRGVLISRSVAVLRRAEHLVQQAARTTLPA
ncbi:hypothetical protein ACMYYO_11195 [Dermacoccaceae bacterium W4C1]